jgi:DNA polymerase III subunit delta
MAKSSTKAGTLTAFEYLDGTNQLPTVGLCAIYGDDAFLKSEVLTLLRQQTLGEGEGGFGLTTFAGREARLRDVLDALASRSLFGDGNQLVIVEEADPFVTEFRAELEDYVTGNPHGLLVLDVKTWPSNTRLAKAVAARGNICIQCAAGTLPQIKSWLVRRAKSAHQVKIDSAAVDALVDLVPPEPGILAQEIAKLSLLAGENRTIGIQHVKDNVGGWRTRAVWDMVDAAADGRTAEALLQLDRLLSSGEKPHGIFPQIAPSLRRFSTAVALMNAATSEGRRLPPRDALAQAGVLPFKLGDAERQLRQLGRHRAQSLTGWLLAVDLAIKSHHSSDDRARIELERLITRLGSAAAKSFENPPPANRSATGAPV